MDKLPMDITDDILCRLPTQTALLAKQVCKTFRNLLRSKTDKVGLFFAETILKEERNILYYGDEYDPISGKMNYNYSCYDNRLDKMRYTEYMVGSCNGLVCIERACMEKPFLVCNPITGQVVYAPRTIKSVTGECYPCGFGYCHSTNEYKIVRMHYQGQRTHVQVYTIGGVGGWRSKGSIHIHPSDIGAYITSNSAAGVYANGALHWLYSKSNIKDFAIMAFDLKDEKVQFLDLSHFKNLRYDCGPKLLGEKNLYLVFSTCEYQPYCTHIWAYKREIITNTTTNACDLKANYNDKNSWHWIKEYRIEWEESFWNDLSLLDPLALTRNNEFLFLYGSRTIYRYDLKTSTLHKLFDGPARGRNMINVIPHANSIVSMPLKGEEVQHHR